MLKVATNGTSIPYLKTSFLKLLDRLDRNLSFRLTCLSSHFAQNFCRHGITYDFFETLLSSYS